MTDKLDNKKIKALSKQLGCTHNDIMTTLLSTTMYEYFNSRGEKLGSIDIGLPCSLREPIRSLKDFKLNNDMVGLDVNLKLFKDFDQGLKHFKKYLTDRLKKSLDPFGMLYLFTVSVNTPFFLPRILVNFVSNKYALTFSNANLSKVPLNYDGLES